METTEFSLEDYSDYIRELQTECHQGGVGYYGRDHHHGSIDYHTLMVDTMVMVSSSIENSETIIIAASLWVGIESKTSHKRVNFSYACILYPT